MASRNAVERKMAELNLCWLNASEDENNRIFVWRTPESSIRLVQGFFALQEAGRSDFSLPDMFVSISEPFDISYSYINAIANNFSERVQLTELPEPRWSPMLPCWTPQDLQKFFERFSQHHASRFRYLVILFQPSSVICETAFKNFIEAFCLIPGKSRLRFALRDTQENPAWDGLLEHDSNQVKLINIDISEDELARQILNETPTTDGGNILRFRQLMTDTFISLRTGTAEQTIQSGQKALDIAIQQGMPEQQVVMLNLMAGAWIQSGALRKAIECYVMAQSSAAQSAPESRYHLLTQVLMAEGNAWYMAKEPLQASERYLLSAQSAQQIPSPTLEMEGFRMAGFSLLNTRPHLATAAEHYYSSLIAALSMSDEERSSSNMMQIFRDLLHWLEPSKVSDCNRLTEKYRDKQAQLICQTERQVAEIGQENINNAVAQYDSELVRSMEGLFRSIIEEREALLLQSGRQYREVLSVARFYSHPFWFPGTDIAHPSERPISEWGCTALIPIAVNPPEPHQVRALFQFIFTGTEERLDVEKT